MSTFGKIYLVISTIIIVVLFGFLIFVRNIPSEAVVAFLGVLVGSIITSFVQYMMSEANIRQQLRVAALDKRLQAHQEAFTKWQRLIYTDRKAEEFTRVILDCQEWWDSNCLYLTADARKAFKKAYLAADNHANFLAMHADVDVIKAAYEDIQRAGKIIVEGICLPSIGEVESKRTDAHSNKGDA